MSTLLAYLTEHREYIGGLAGVLATLALLPQVLKTVKDRRTADISLAMYSLFCAGVALWMLYGLLIGSRAMLISNAVTLLLAGTVLALKIKNG